MGVDFPIGFGRYSLIERLAVGGMAELFVATSPGEHGFTKKVVIKRLLPHLVDDETYNAMFIDEAKLTARLVHPKVAQTFELGKVDGALFIAMEHVDGIDVLALLREFASRRRRVAPELAAWIAHEVLDALDYAHNLAEEDGSALGVVHRDISPSNVLLSVRGDVKLVDFGIARAKDPDRAHKSKSGTLKGKYGYMSPEQVIEQNVDARSDLFSVGVVLAELLTGRRLFAAANELDVLLMVRDAKLTRFDKYGADIEPGLSSIVRTALKKPIEERWQNAAAFRDALNEWLFDHRHRMSPKNVADVVNELRDTVNERRVRQMSGGPETAVVEPDAGAAVAAAQAQAAAHAVVPPPPPQPSRVPTGDDGPIMVIEAEIEGGDSVPVISMSYEPDEPKASGRPISASDLAAQAQVAMTTAVPVPAPAPAPVAKRADTNRPVPRAVIPQRPPTSPGQSQPAIHVPPMREPTPLPIPPPAPTPVAIPTPIAPPPVAVPAGTQAKAASTSGYHERPVERQLERPLERTSQGIAKPRTITPMGTPAVSRTMTPSGTPAISRTKTPPSNPAISRTLTPPAMARTPTPLRESVRRSDDHAPTGERSPLVRAETDLGIVEVPIADTISAAVEAITSKGGEDTSEPALIHFPAEPGAPDLPGSVGESRPSFQRSEDSGVRAFDSLTEIPRRRPEPVAAMPSAEELAFKRPPTPPTLSEIDGQPDDAGDFSVTSPLRVLFRLMTARATGLLVVAVGGIKKEIYVRDGQPEYVSSNVASELFGNYLVAKGVLSDGELAMALAMMPHYGGKLGDTLVGLGLLKPLEVFRHLTRQVRSKIIDVCTWNKGGFGWYAGRENPREAFPLDFNAFEILGAGAMALSDDVVDAWITKNAEARLRASRARRVGPERFEVKGLVELAEGLDGKRSVAELIDVHADRVERLKMARMLCLLEACDLARAG